MKGTWIGTYKHESKRIPESKRNQITMFKIVITEFDGINFSGEVEDDVDTGGTRGKGIIEGQIINGKITFVKKMPIQTYLLPDGSLKEENQPHRKIYYSGTFDNDSIKGTWKFKFGIGKINNKLALFLPIKGKWEMKRNVL
jgi:hypothetical protein